MTELYSTGTIAVTADSVDFVGAGTAWLPVNAKAGDTLNVAGHVVLIAEISDPTHGKFAIPYPGETAAGLPYAIAKTSSEWGTNRTLALQTAEMIQLLTTIVVERTGIAFDAYGSLAGRDAHDDKPAGFVYLAVTPAPWTLYIKLSGDAADWDAGQAMEGAPGPSNVLTIGTVEDGEDADATITGASPDQQLNLVLPRGAASTVPGPANELTIGTVEGGVTADATITGDAPNQVLNLQLPKGDTGDAATVTVGTVTTVEPTEPASVTNSGTSGAAVFEFEIPRGSPGAGSVDSVNGDPGPDIVLDADDIDDTSTTHKFATAAEKTKLGHISITQAVDLDAIETRVAALDAAVVLKGTWNASAGTFPGSGSAQAGESWIVSVAGTVNSVAFAVGDRVIAILDNASTSTFASNWFKADYTDQVSSVAGRTGAVTLSNTDIGGLGNAATRNVGTTAGTVTAGDDSRITGAAQKSSNLSDLPNVLTARTNLKIVVLAAAAYAVLSPPDANTLYFLTA